jgi:hypothetical protein
MSNEGSEIISNPSAHTEVKKLPQIPDVSIGLTGLLLQDFKYDGYEQDVTLRFEGEPDKEEFWRLDHFENREGNGIISLFNEKWKRRLQSVIVDDSTRIIREIKISRNSREVIVLYTTHKDDQGNWI